MWRVNNVSKDIMGRKVIYMNNFDMSNFEIGFVLTVVGIAYFIGVWLGYFLWRYRNV